MLPWRQDAEMGPSHSLYDVNKETKGFMPQAQSSEPGALAAVQKFHFGNSGLANKYSRNKRLGATRCGPPKYARQNWFLNGLS